MAASNVCVVFLVLVALAARPTWAQRWRPAILTAIRYQNTACSGDQGEAGTCLTQQECVTRAGTVAGTCGNGAMACCAFKFTCGARTAHNETAFVNPAWPRGDNGTNTCQVTVDKANDVCQLRLDFEEFELEAPDENGRCTVDSFMVRTTVGERLPMLCGSAKGQHLYVDMGRGSANPVVLSVVTNGERSARRWKVKISMIPCTNLLMAPSGCLQYFRSPSAVVKSFNFGSSVEGRARYLSNLRYSACVRVEENFCAIRWTPAEVFEFGSGDGNATVGSAGAACSPDDFVAIDQASADGVGPGEDRLCGGQLLGGAVVSRSKPFQLRVRSNSDSAPNALWSQRGFALQYVQLPCVH